MKNRTLPQWREFLSKLKNPKHSVKIGLVGKYVELADSYKSISESLIHGGAYNECKVYVEFIHSEKITETNVNQLLEHLNGILVAPGFGSRGIDGKILAARFARENAIPFFGICLGMQCAVIEYRKECSWDGGGSFHRNRSQNKISGYRSYGRAKEYN